MSHPSRTMAAGDNLLPPGGTPPGRLLWIYHERERYAVSSNPPSGTASLGAFKVEAASKFDVGS